MANNKGYTLIRTRYWTMNSWNRSKAPAYNMKIPNIIADPDIRSRLYDIIGYENAYDYVNCLINDFDDQFNHEWQAGFNGRSGGYLVLYKGHRDINTGQVSIMPGLNIENDEVPEEVLNAFQKLAEDIQAYAIYAAEHSRLEEVEVVSKKTILVIDEEE